MGVGRFCFFATLGVFTYGMHTFLFVNQVAILCFKKNMEDKMTGLGDLRLDRVMDEMIERARDRQTLVLRQLANGRSEEVKYGRFVGHDDFSYNDMVDRAVKLVRGACEGRHVLLVQDTTEANFGFDTFQKNMGPVGNGESQGFLLHPVVAMDAADGQCLGLANVEAIKRSHCDGDRNKLPFEAKMSHRWLSSVRDAKSHCLGATCYTVVSDREGDIYDALCGYDKEGLEYVVRSWHNRPLKDADDVCLWELIEKWPIEGAYECDLPRTDKRNAHRARLEVKFGAAELKRPERRASAHLPASLKVFAVEVKECVQTVVKGQEPLHWRLVTSHRIADMDMALLIILYYVRRWNIEQVFRILKSQGLNLAGSLIETYEGLCKMAVVGLVAAVRVMQLVTGRNNTQEGSINMAFSEAEIKMVHIVGPTLEGRTEIQKNPHGKQTLAYAAWVIARLGGWKGYSKSERPPGPITMFNGLKRFQHYIEAQSVLLKANNGP